MSNDFGSNDFEFGSFNFDNLPDDPEQAFIQLERHFTSELELDLHHASSAPDRESAYIEYMSKTVGAAAACGVDIGDHWQIPSHASEYSVVDNVRDFQSAVRRVILQTRIAAARENKQNTYVLSGPDKEKIRHFVDRIKEIIDAANLSVDKHDSLFAYLDKFVRAVDQQRTNPQALSSLLIGMANTGGEMARKLKPARDLIVSIAKVFTPYQERDEAKRQLPQPTPRRRIEHKPAPQTEREVEEDIPF